MIVTFKSFSGRYLHCLAISTYLSRSSGAILRTTVDAMEEAKRKSVHVIEGGND